MYDKKKEQGKRKQKYEVEKNNILVVKNKKGNGYFVTNLSNLKMYSVKNENGKITCTCPDWKYRGSKYGFHCKHQIAVYEIWKKKTQTRTMHVNDIRKFIERW